MLLPIVPGAAFASPPLTAAFAKMPRPRLHRHVRLQPPRMSAGDAFGLTDDGDFAILGVNAEEKVEGERDGEDSPGRNVNAGTPIGWQGVGGMLFNEELMRSGRVDLGVGPGNRYRDFRGNDIVPKVDPAVRDWLKETLPSLVEGDLEAYAEGLTDIGFHPRCASMCELRYDDLSFMRVLHRRYLYKEITGEDHPFEP